MKGIYVAFVLFFVLFGLTFLNLFPNGYEWDYQSFGVAASGALILIVNLQVLVMIETGVGGGRKDKCIVN